MICFKVDGNARIGMGHVMRCLAIADELKKENHSCFFLMENDLLSELVKKHGHRLVVLEDGIKSVVEFINQNRIVACIVDSYEMGDADFQLLNEACDNRNAILGYMDDLLLFPYACNLLVNYNIYATISEYEELYQNKQKPFLCLGTNYVPFRTEFHQIANRCVRKEGKRILVSTGGADTEHVTVEMVKTICQHPEWSSINFVILIGKMNNDKEEIMDLAEGNNNIILQYDVSDVAQLMLSCEVAISAAGSTLYELCLTQTPSISYVLADNQIKLAKAFYDKGIMLYAGDVRKEGLHELVEKMSTQAVRLLEDFPKRCDYSKKMKTIVDCNGANRIAKTILEVGGK